MTTTTADDLRTNLIGAWALQSYEARSIDASNVTYPLGVDAQGTIIYTPAARWP
jgi:Lipocalin-like domain